jgi:hypothetical protein
MEMLLVIMLCTSGNPDRCDRIVQPIEHCSSPSYMMFQVQALLAQTGLYDGTQRIKIDCIKGDK